LEETVLSERTACLRFALWAHTHCTLVITTRRLVFIDSKHERYSFEIAMDDLRTAKLHKNTMTSDLEITLANGKKHTVGLSEAEIDAALADIHHALARHS